MIINKHIRKKVQSIVPNNQKVSQNQTQRVQNLYSSKNLHPPLNHHIFLPPQKSIHRKPLPNLKTNNPPKRYHLKHYKKKIFLAKRL